MIWFFWMVIHKYWKHVNYVSIPIPAICKASVKLNKTTITAHGEYTAAGMISTLKNTKFFFFCYCNIQINEMIFFCLVLHPVLMMSRV